MASLDTLELGAEAQEALVEVGEARWEAAVALSQAVAAYDGATVRLVELERSRLAWMLEGAEAARELLRRMR